MNALDKLIKLQSKRMPLKTNKKNLALLRAIIAQESSFNVMAKSHCGARGLMQIMPATAKGMGCDPDLLWFPTINLQYGIEYFCWQYSYFTSQSIAIELALASYNAGRGYIDAAYKLAAYKLTDFAVQPSWSQIVKELPNAKVRGKICDIKQVTHYVARIMKMYKEEIDGV